MNKISLFLWIPLLLLTACDPNSGNRPTDQNNTVWVADEYNVCFQVIPNIDLWNIGYLKDNNEIIEIQFGFRYGNGVDVFKLINGKKINSDPFLFEGKCKFKNTEFTITVTESKIDSVTVGDKITFNRVDELPEWAKELEKELEESVTGSSG
jgi:hypothetical protein